MNTFKDLLERVSRIKRQVKYSQNELNAWLKEYNAFKNNLLKKYSPSEVEYIMSVVKAADVKSNHT